MAHKKLSVCGTAVLLLVLAELALHSESTFVSETVDEELHPMNVSSGASNRVCLVMIVKNEDDTIVSTLESVLNHTTAVFICDTGSTDDTLKVISGFLEPLDFPYTIVSHKWRGFSENRNECIEAAQEQADCDYLLLMDAGQRLVPATQVVHPLRMLPNLTADSYFLEQRSHGVKYQNLKLVKASLDWMYEGRVHEYITRRTQECQEPGTTTSPTLPFTVIGGVDGRGGGKEPGARFARDVEILEEEVRAHPNDARSWFYLGNSYFALDNYVRAAESYVECIKLEGWVEERFTSAYSFAQSLEKLWVAGIDIPAQLAVHVKSWITTGKALGGPEAVYHLLSAYIAASAVMPDRREPYFDISRLYREHLGDHSRCFAHASAGVAVGEPKRSAIFIQEDVVELGIFDELCVCSYYVAKYQEGLQACLLLRSRLELQLSLEETSSRIDYLNDMLTRTTSNIDFYKDTSSV